MEKFSECETAALEAEKKEEAERECKARSDKEYLEEQEHPNTKPSVAETEESKIQELTDEEDEKLQKGLDLKSNMEASSSSANKKPVSRSNNEDDDNNEKVVCSQISRSEEDISALSPNASIEDSLETKKNPMLMGPVIRCVLKFLKVKDIKNCRLVSREWGSTGKIILGSCALIHFHKDEYIGPIRRPEDFYSLFLNSTTLFSAFKISGHLTKESTNNSWTVQELTNFFDKQQKYIKELSLKFGYSNEKIDWTCWISNSPMILKDAKHMTKLTIEGFGSRSMFEIPPLHLISNIKDLELSNCRVNLETGILISPVKLKLGNATFFQDGIKLDPVRINDVVDFCKTKKVSLDCTPYPNPKYYFVDIGGNITLESLDLQGVEIVNGETSQWVIENLSLTSIPYSLSSQMKIKELSLFLVGIVDLSTLPNSIENLILHGVCDGTVVRCTQPVVLENLQCLQIVDTGEPAVTNWSFLSYFANCPQLSHLQLSRSTAENMKSLWMPKSIKTVTLEHDSFINWLDDSYWNLEKLVLLNCDSRVREICRAKIQVEDFFVYFINVGPGGYLSAVLEYQKSFSFCKRLYYGQIYWGKKNGQFDLKSSYYVFEIDNVLRAISKRAFHQLLPKSFDLGLYMDL